MRSFCRIGHVPGRIMGMIICGILWSSPPRACGDDGPKFKVPCPVKVSVDHHFLLDQDGKPFFYLSDTAWELFHRLSFDEADRYLRDRASKRFNVVQAVVLAEYGGLVEPNSAGDLPLEASDPGRPIEAYFRHVDRVVERAEDLGLVVAMLPTWGDKWNKKWGQGPEIFSPENAIRYGEFLGRRYRDKAVIWILGGDRPVETDRQRAIVREMAEGLRRGDGGRHLMTFHPPGGKSSSDFFENESWVDFHMIQSGHDYDRPNDLKISEDYARTPTKPCLDGEPGYEDHPAGFKASNGYLADRDVRKFAYWSLFAGACGHTYGCHDVWQFFDGRRKPITEARTPWTSAIDLPGAGQMRWARGLIESRPMLSRIPDQSILSSPRTGAGHLQATRDADGSFAFIYSPRGESFEVDLEKLSGTNLRVTWFNPRDGSAQISGEVPRLGRHTFVPPSSGNGEDWILVLDDVSRNFAPIGHDF